MINRPIAILIGKPTKNTFIVGIVLAIVPNAMSVRKREIIIGAEIFKAIINIYAEYLIINSPTLPLISTPAGGINL